MIVSNEINAYATAPVFSGPPDMNAGAADTGGGSQSGGAYSQNGKQAAPASSKVVTEPDGSTVMQYTTVSPGGSIMRKNVMLHRAEAFSPDPMNISPMLRHRSDAYEGMMQIF